VKMVVRYLIFVCLLVIFVCTIAKAEPTSVQSTPSTQSGTAAGQVSSQQEQKEEEGEEEEEDSQTPSSTSGAAPHSASANRANAKMRRLNFPEGRFAISLPGNPDMEYKQVPIAGTKLNLRAVSYVYKEPTGNFNVSYMIFPKEVNLNKPGLANSILDSVANSFAKLPSSPGTASGIVSQKNISMLGFPGKEILVKGKQGGTEVFSLVRMFISGQYLYILAPEGKRAWLDSPSVATFMSSMTLSTASTTSGSAGSHFGSSTTDVHKKQSDFQKKFEADRRTFNEKFARSKDNFTRDRNAQKSRWDRNRF
jgi:hypothetical protein